MILFTFIAQAVLDKFQHLFEKIKFVLIPLHFWKAGKTNFQKDLSSPIDVQTESTIERMSFFNSLPQSLKSIKKHSPSNETSNDIKIIQHSNQQCKLKEYLLDHFKKESKAKKIIEDLFFNPSIQFSNGNTIVVNNTYTENNVRYFVYDLRHKSANFNPRYSIILQQLKLPSTYHANSTALTGDDDSWITFSFCKTQTYKIIQERTGSVRFNIEFR